MHNKLRHKAHSSILAIALAATLVVITAGETQACGTSSAITPDRQAAASGYCTAGPKPLPGG